MKKFLFSVVIIVCVFMCAFVGCFDRERLTDAQKISRRLGMSVESGVVETYTSDHSSFNGDGETYAKVTFEDESFCGLIVQSGNWLNLPLTQTLSVAVYGGTLPNGMSWSSLIEDDNDQPLIPQIDEGYYYFKDRSRQSENEKDDSQIFERYSFNFTIAIYDLVNRTLYFFEIDT